MDTTAVIYNVTIKVAAGIADNWLHWLTTEHVHEVLATKCFHEARVVRLMEVDDSEGPTYAVQYSAASKADYNRYIQQYADKLRQASYDKWGDRFIAFRSVMEVIKTV